MYVKLLRRKIQLMVFFFVCFEFCKIKEGNAGILALINAWYRTIKEVKLLG